MEKVWDNSLSTLINSHPGEPAGQQVERIRFSYEAIEMWEKHPEDILDLGHVVLYPLLSLTKGGATRKIVTRMLDLLSGEQHLDFAVIGYLFATRTFQLGNQDTDLEWLKERFRHMHDFLRESPAYQWILDEGREEGREEQKAQGLAQMRQTVVEIVQELNRLTRSS